MVAEKTQPTPRETAETFSEDYGGLQHWWNAGRLGHSQSNLPRTDMPIHWY